MSNTDESIGKQLKNAVENEDLATVTKICESEGFDINATLIELYGGGSCTVLYYAVLRNKVDIARYLLTLQQVDVTVLHTTARGRDSPLHYAVINNNSELAALLLERGAERYLQDEDGYSPLADAAMHGYREVGELLVSGPVDALIAAKEEGDTLTATTELVQMYTTTEARYRAVVTTYIVEMEKVLEILLKNSSPEIVNVEVRDTSLRLLSLITECFQKIADDPKLSFFLFKGNSFLLFVELVSGDLSSQQGLDLTTILKTTYVLLQAKVRCDKSKVKFLRNLVKPDLFAKFSVQIQTYAEQEKDNNLQCIARRIFSEYLYIAEKNTVIEIKCISPDKEETVKQETSKKDTPKVGIHRCKARGYFTLLVCFLGLYSYTNDLVTDFLVGLEDYQMFSTRLGFFELFLVVFTLVHENINSAFVLYETEIELLQIKLGKADIVSQDWKESQLNYSDNPIFAFLLKFLWPFRINGECCGAIKAVLYNILSLIMLRPVVDRLVVLLHEPSSLRTYFRQQAEQNSLKQFYLILEQLPELLVQFYTFQIILNKISISPVEECNLDFYSDYKDKFNNTEQNFFCGKILHYTESGLVSCGVVFRIYSMLFPFCTIPSGIVSLESSFGTLDPTSPKMSTSATFMVRLVYMLSIPARLFMFAGVMHAVPNHLAVIYYIICRIGLELVINLKVHKCYAKVIRPGMARGQVFKSCKHFFKSMWSLVLFSMRDVFLISLRHPYAYTQKPSEVTGNSLRSPKTLAIKSIPYFVEGVAGAILIQLNYPCGKRSHIFKYQGWFCVLLLVLSAALYWLLIVITDTEKKQDSKEKKRDDTADPQDDITCSVTCGISCSACCISCLCFVCRCCCRGQPSGADVELQPVPITRDAHIRSADVERDLEASRSDTDGAEATVKDTLLSRDLANIVI